MGRKIRPEFKGKAPYDRGFDEGLKIGRVCGLLEAECKVRVSV
jgi:hypothetical protein